MHAEPGPGEARPPQQQTLWYTALMRLALCYGFVLLSTVLVVAFANPSGGSTGDSLFWVANGVFLAFLLTAPRKLVPLCLLTGTLALFTASLFLDDGIRPQSQFYNLLNLLEVSLSTYFLRGRTSHKPRFTDVSYLTRFTAIAVVASPLLSGLVYALYAKYGLHLPFLHNYFCWSVSDGLGTAVVTPAFVAALHGHYKKLHRMGQFYLPVAMVAATVVSFSQAGIPYIFLIYPLLVLNLLQLDLGWAAIELLFIAITSATFTLHHHGPFAALTAYTHTDPSVILQLFILTGMFLLYSVSIVLEHQRKTERKLKEIAALHQLVTENSRDVIILADFNGKRSYVSAATTVLCGYTPEEVRTQNSFELVHPLDLEKSMDAVKEIMNGLEGTRLELRVQKKDQSYLWVESVLRLVRDPDSGRPTHILNIVRDISERKQAEQQLQEAYHTVEALAVTDALTNLANRRRFDQYLSSEWRRAMRDRTPLALIMIDADFFKAYNDCFGHPRGDGALKQIAEAAQDVVSRPGDLVARFGGEEFAVILPNTDEAGVCKLAEEICQSMRARKLAHPDSPQKILTISAGCCAIVPKLGTHAVLLVEQADKALYIAKAQGRDRVCCGCNEAGTERPASSL